MTGGYSDEDWWKRGPQRYVYRSASICRNTSAYNSLNAGRAIHGNARGNAMPPRNLTPEHKQAMAAGRKEGQAVKAYLDALEEHRPKRGRRRTADSIKARLG